MKKTLVAIAAMAAVTGVMAQATMYGVIDQAYTSSKVTAGTTTTKKTSVAGTLNGGSALGITGSDDLGGGMKAYFQHEFGMATDANDAVTNRYSYLGLSGGFGDVKIGKMYNFAFNNAIANDPAGFSGTAGYAVNGAYGGGAASTSNMIAYTAPSFTPGLGIQVGKAMGEASTTAAAPTKTGDSTSWGVTYAAGALYAGVTGETVIKTAAIKTKHSTTTITYDLGMVKVGFGSGKSTEGTDYDKASAVSISVPVGAATFAYSSGDAKTKDGTAAEVTTKVSQYGVAYSLSKRTMGYLLQGKQSATASTTNIYAVGIKHSF